MSEHAHVNYKKIYLWLVALFIVSVLGPEMTENKVLILIFAFGIAIVKAIMVAGWFMHLAHEKKFIWYAFITAMAFMFLFVVAVAPDIMKPHGQNWKSKIHVSAEAVEHGGNHGQHHGATGHDKAQHGAPEHQH